jgi:site-specific DNA recombinase
MNAGYVRVSTEDQARDGYSLDEQQRLICERAGEARMFVDAGLSGAKADRPAYQSMLAAAAAGEIEAVYVWKFDRLGRDAEELLRARRMLEAAGVRLVSLTEGEAESTLVYGVRALVAQEEREKISQRTSMGMAAAAAAGRPNGGPRRYGFDQREGTLTPRPDEVEFVQKMFELAREGKSQATIAREINAAGGRTAQGYPWSQPRIGQVLRDRIWLGKLRNQAGEFQVMEPVIDPELWEAVQRTMGSAGERRGKPSERFLLSHGLLRCGRCGSPMRVRSERKDYGPYDHYSCAGRRSGASECDQPAVRREYVDKAVLEYFRLVALDVEGTCAQLAGERDRRLAEVDARGGRARKVLAEAERQQERLDGLLREGLTMDEWHRVSAVPQQEAAAAALALEDLARERSAIEESADAIDASAEFRERISALRAAVAGEVLDAEGIAATQAALRRVFHGLVLHRADSPTSPRRVNAELGLGVPGYVLEPRVRADVLEGTLRHGTPVLTRVPLESGGIKAQGR